MDNNTAKIGAQELDHEVAKQCSPQEPETGKPGDEASSSSSADHAHTANKDEKVDLERIQSEPPPPAIKVPHAQRRGLFGRFTVVAEVTEPHHYPRFTKWFITFVIACAAIAAPLGSAILFRKPDLQGIVVI